jgi:hypothetical protein
MGLSVDGHIWTGSPNISWILELMLDLFSFLFLIVEVATKYAYKKE